MESIILHHYTSLDSLVNILNSEEDFFILRATQVDFLNDFKECKNIKDVIVNSLNGYQRLNNKTDETVKYYSILSFIDSCLNKLSNSFILSFSENADDLGMWRGYAKNGNGVTIAFDSLDLNNLTDSNLTYLLKCEYNTHKLINDWHDTWQMEYDKIKNETRGELKMNDLSILKKIIIQSFMLKNSEFSSEKEWRFCSLFTKGQYVNFRSTGNTIIPYIEIKIPKNYIKEIVIGPCLNIENIQKGIFQILKLRNYNFGEIPIRSSIIPYRQL